MAQSLNILPRTVASFYGSTVPRPYVVCDALGEVMQDRVAKPRVNAALVEWARAQSWSRGGLLADAVLRSAGRTTDASGRRKLRAEGDEEDDEGDAIATGPARRAKPRAARKTSAKRLSRHAGSTPARKRPRKALEEEEEEEDWDGKESSEEEEEGGAFESDEEEDSDDEDGARGVAETPARLAALRPGTGALVLAPAQFKRLRRASGASPLALPPPPPPPPHTTPAAPAAPAPAQTPTAPPRWRLKTTKRQPSEPSPRVRPEATPHRSASVTPGRSLLARTPSASVKKQNAEKRRRRL